MRNEQEHFFRRRLRLRPLATSNHRQGGRRPAWTVGEEVSKPLKTNQCCRKRLQQKANHFSYTNLQGGVLAEGTVYGGKPGAKFQRGTNLIHAFSAMKVENK